MIMQGQARNNHKYIARVQMGNGFRYFYTQAEIDAYKAMKNKGATPMSKIRKKGAGIVKATPQVMQTYVGGRAAPTGHIQTNSVGKVISGYDPNGGKPSSISDEEWNRMQKLWSARYGGQPVAVVAALPEKKKKKATNRHVTATASSGYRSTGSSTSSSSSSGSSSKKTTTKSSVTYKDVFNALNTVNRAIAKLKKKSK